MKDENIDLSKKANDAYCNLGKQYEELSADFDVLDKALKYYKERCRLAENIMLAEKEGMSISLAWTEYYQFINNVKNPAL